jgi:hypothetical protein
VLCILFGKINMFIIFILHNIKHPNSMAPSWCISVQPRTISSILLCFSKHHAIKTRTGGTDPHILNLYIKWSWLISFTPCLLYFQGKNCRYMLRGWVGTRACLDMVAKRSAPAGNPVLVIQPVTSHCPDLIHFNITFLSWPHALCYCFSRHFWTINIHLRSVWGTMDFNTKPRKVSNETSRQLTQNGNILQRRRRWPNWIIENQQNLTLMNTKLGFELTRSFHLSSDQMSQATD